MRLTIAEAQARLDQLQAAWRAEDDAEITIIFPKYQTVGRRKAKLPKAKPPKRERAPKSTAPRRRRVSLVRRQTTAPSPVADAALFTYRPPSPRSAATSYVTDDWREQK